MLCCSCGHVLFGRRFFRERPRQHELGLEHRPGPLDHAVEGGRHPAEYGMPDPALDVRDDLRRSCARTRPVEVLGHDPELDDQIAGEVLRLGLAALLPPQPEQGRLIVAHDDPGVGAADEGAAALTGFVDAGNFTTDSEYIAFGAFCPIW